jgi:hypothetical protein
MQTEELVTPKYKTRALLAVLCFVAFSITLPPLGLLLFLGFAGIVDNRSGSAFAEWIESFQDVLMTALIIGFGILSIWMVLTRKATIFRILSALLILLATASFGGCMMGLNNLNHLLGS